MTATLLMYTAPEIYINHEAHMIHLNYPTTYAFC